MSAAEAASAPPAAGATSGDAPAVAIDVRGLHKRFGRVHALRGVDLSVRRGEFFGLLGPNGAGKSTLINILAGLTRASAGSAAVLGHDVWRQATITRRALGVVPQELVYDPFFSVREFLDFQAGYYGRPRAAAGWIDYLLEALSLADKADTNMRALSGGMKRRVLIAQALVHRPRVLVLDEPTAGVDVELRQGLWEFVRELHGEGMTIVLTTHYLEEAESLCDRIAIVSNGEIVALDHKDELLARDASYVLKLRVAQLPASLPPEIDARRERADGTWLWLRVQRDGGDLQQVLAVCAGARLQIEELATEERSLESVFLELTGHRPQRDDPLAPQPPPAAWDSR